MTSTAPGLDVPITSGPEASGLPTGPTSFYRAQSMRLSSVVLLLLGCKYETIGSNVPAMQWTAHSSLRWLPAGIWSHCGGRPVGSRACRCGGQSCCLPNLARSEAAKLASHTLQVLSLPAHRQDVTKQAWKAQVTDSRAFSVCYSWQVVDLAQ